MLQLFTIDLTFYIGYFSKFKDFTLATLSFSTEMGYSVTADSAIIDIDTQKTFTTDYPAINTPTTFTNVTASNWQTTIIEKLITQSVTLERGSNLELFPDLT